MNKLKRIGPRIEPCGTPYKSDWKMLHILLTSKQLQTYLVMRKKGS